MSASLNLYVDDLWMSPYVMYVYVALKEKGVDFQTHEIALHRNEHRRPNYQALSLNEKVPTLEMGTFRLSESLSIIEFVEEKYAFPNYPRILPAEIETRAQARQIMDWLGSDFLALRRERPTSTIFYKAAEMPMSAECSYEAQKLLGVASRYLSAGQANLFGEWSIADTVFSMMLNRLAANNENVPQYVFNYVKNQWSRPSVADYVKHKRPSQLP